MKIQKTLVAAVALALAGAAYAGGDKNKSMTSAQGSAEVATQQQSSFDSTMQSTTSASASQSASANGQSSSANGQSSAQAGDESVRQLQQQLKDKGFDPGPIDGIDGPKTQAALRKAQEAGGLNASASSDLSTSSATSSSGPSSSESTGATTSSQPSTTESNSTSQPK